MMDEVMKLAHEPMFSNFTWGELFPMEILMGDGKGAALLLDNRIPWILMALRNNFGPVTINTWHNGGQFSYRGYRPWNVKVGKPFSQHKFGRGIDFDVKGMTAEEVREAIKKDQKFWLEKGITRIEDKVSWNHLDLAMVKTPFMEPQKQIVFFGA